MNPVSPFAAHPKIDPETGELFNFGINFASAQPSLNLYRFGADGSLVYRRRLPLGVPASLHDFCLSGRHVIFHVGPYVMDMSRLAAGGSLLDALRWEPERGSELLIVRREDGEPVASVPVGSRYVLHGINAFEEGDRLTVDVVELDRPVYDQYVLSGLFTDVGPGRPVRFVIDLPTGALLETREIAYDRAPDFPAIDPALAGRPYEDLWMLGISRTGRPGRKFFDQVVHASWAHPDRVEVWQAPPGWYLGGEPAFAPNPSDGGGAVICQRFDAATGESAFLVFDAFGVEQGPGGGAAAGGAGASGVPCGVRAGGVRLFSLPCPGGIPAGRAPSRPARFLRFSCQRAQSHRRTSKTAPPASFPALRETFPALQEPFPPLASRFRVSDRIPPPARPIPSGEREARTSRHRIPRASRLPPERERAIPQASHRPQNGEQDVYSSCIMRIPGESLVPLRECSANSGE